MLGNSLSGICNMFESTKHEYSVKTCPTSEPEELEVLLNEMADDNWDLFMMNEAESKDGDIQYNCIFVREYKELIQEEQPEIFEAGDFKTRMEKMMSPSEEPYQQCKETQDKINRKHTEIDGIKQSLESTSDPDERENLNEELSENLEEYELLKTEFSEIINPIRMYERIAQDKLALVISEELLDIADPKKNGDLIAETVNLRQKLTDELGYVIPAIKFSSSDTLEANEYNIYIRGVNAVSGFAYHGHLRFRYGQNNITRKPKDAIEDVDPLTGESVFWLETAKTKDFWEAGQTPSQVISEHLAKITVKLAEDLMDYNDVARYMEIAGSSNLYLLEHLFPDKMTLGDLKYIFSNLIRENVSVKDVVFIFEKINDYIDYTKEKDILLQKIRIALAKQICQSITDENGNIYGIYISKEECEKLEELLDTEADKFYFPPNDPKVKKLVKRISDVVKDAENDITNTAIICHPGIRTEIFDLIDNSLPGISVLSYEEAANKCNIELLLEIA